VAAPHCRRSLILLGLGLAFVATACATPSATPETRASLAQELERAIAGFDGTVGLYVNHLQTNEQYAHKADERFPTASMIKVPIMATLFDRIDRGELSYSKKLKWDRKRIYPGHDLLAKVVDGEQISLEQLLVLMLAFSDNTASLWLQELAGTGTRINEWLAHNGYSNTRMNSRTPGRKRDWEKFGWGQTTPREMARLLVQIWTGRGFTHAAAETMHRHLTRSVLTHGALEEIPPDVQVASKQGAVSASRSEVFLVHAPHGAYVCCVITKKQADQSWQRHNAGYQLIRRVSRVLWQHFEPQSGWAPPRDIERF